MHHEHRLEFDVERLEQRKLLTAATVYEPQVDPAVGFNMVSFVSESAVGKSNWVRGVEQLHATGATEVTFAFYRVLNGDTGRFLPHSGPKFSHMARGVRRAAELGMSITITPLFEVTDTTGDFYWRGEYDPSGRAQGRFQASYERWVKRLTRLATKHDAQQLNVGSEMQDFVRNESNHTFFRELIDWVDAKFEGELGYAANWSNYNHASVNDLFWSNEKIDVMGISAYFSERLASNNEADASQQMGAAAFENLMETRWSDLLENELIPYAAARKGGQGIPLVIQEFGVTPYNRTSVVPWSVNPGETTGADGETLDPDEQRAVVRGLLRALDGHQDQIQSVHFWTWSFDSNRQDLFGLDPNQASDSQPTAIAIQEFLDSSIQSREATSLQASGHGAPGEPTSTPETPFRSPWQRNITQLVRLQELASSTLPGDDLQELFDSGS